MKTIAIIVYRMSVGGAERLIVDEIRELIRRGHQVHLMTLAPEAGATLMGEVPPLCKHILVPFRRLIDIRATRELAHVLTRVQPEVVFTHLWFSNTVGRIAAWFSYVPCISFEHNVYDHVKTWKQFLVDRVLQRFSKRIIAVSEAVRESLVSHGISSRRIVVVPNGIDLARLRGVDKKEARTRLGLRGEFTWLFVGRLTRQKGADVLLDAFARGTDSTLLLAGDGEERRSLEGRAQTLGIGNRTRFLGARSDIPELLAAADGFVFPSRWEGYGISLAEALAAGLPSITSDLPSVRDIVGKDAAFLVPPGDVAALGSAIQKIENDAALRSKLSSAAKARAEAFSISSHIGALLAALQ